ERDVRLERAKPLPRGGGIAIDEGRADAERVHQLQLRARGMVQRGRDVALERLEPARRPELRLARLCAERRLRTDREDLGRDAQEPARVVGDVRSDFAGFLL